MRTNAWDNKLLATIRNQEEYFPKSSPYGDWVEVIDNDKQESIYLPASVTFNAIVIALKELKVETEVSIYYKCDCDEHSTYKYNKKTSKVERIKECRGYVIYGERDVA